MQRVVFSSCVFSLNLHLGHAKAEVISIHDLSSSPRMFDTMPMEKRRSLESAYYEISSLSEFIFIVNRSFAAVYFAFVKGEKKGRKVIEIRLFGGS
jgi:hypothetical protein